MVREHDISTFPLMGWGYFVFYVAQNMLYKKTSIVCIHVYQACNLFSEAIFSLFSSRDQLVGHNQLGGVVMDYQVRYSVEL